MYAAYEEDFETTDNGYANDGSTEFDSFFDDEPVAKPTRKPVKTTYAAVPRDTAGFMESMDGGLMAPPPRSKKKQAKSGGGGFRKSAIMEDSDPPQAPFRPISEDTRLRKIPSKGNMFEKPPTASPLAPLPKKKPKKPVSSGAALMANFEELTRVMQQLDGLKIKLLEAEKEIKTLKIVNRRQELAIQKMDKDHADMPRVMQQLTDELRGLRAAHNVCNSKIASAEKSSQAHIDENLKLHEQIHRLNSLLKAKHLEDHDSMQKTIDRLKVDQERKNLLIEELQKKAKQPLTERHRESKIPKVKGLKSHHEESYGETEDEIEPKAALPKKPDHSSKKEGKLDHSHSETHSNIQSPTFFETTPSSHNIPNFKRKNPDSITFDHNIDETGNSFEYTTADYGHEKLEIESTHTSKSKSKTPVPPEERSLKPNSFKTISASEEERHKPNSFKPSFLPRRSKDTAMESQPAKQEESFTSNIPQKAPPPVEKANFQDHEYVDEDFNFENDEETEKPNAKLRNRSPSSEKRVNETSYKPFTSLRNGVVEEAYGSKEDPKKMKPALGISEPFEKKPLWLSEAAAKPKDTSGDLYDPFANVKAKGSDKAPPSLAKPKISDDPFQRKEDEKQKPTDNLYMPSAQHKEFGQSHLKEDTYMPSSQEREISKPRQEDKPYIPSYMSASADVLKPQKSDETYKPSYNTASTEVFKPRQPEEPYKQSYNSTSPEVFKSGNQKDTYSPSSLNSLPKDEPSPRKPLWLASSGDSELSKQPQPYEINRSSQDTLPIVGSSSLSLERENTNAESKPLWLQQSMGTFKSTSEPSKPLFLQPKSTVETSGIPNSFTTTTNMTTISQQKPTSAGFNFDSDLEEEFIT
ncbi:hypothetical protein HDU67_006989 [Dinochytrium kinnereticum]|nr:hypothetical protein HDU67_006989 [Dinochytrium kinnereticum]